MGIFKTIASIAVGVARVLTGATDKDAQEYVNQQKIANENKKSEINQTLTSETRSDAEKTEKTE